MAHGQDGAPSWAAQHGKVLVQGLRTLLRTQPRTRASDAQNQRRRRVIADARRCFETVMPKAAVKAISLAVKLPVIALALVLPLLVVVLCHRRDLHFIALLRRVLTIYERLIRYHRDALCRERGGARVSEVACADFGAFAQGSQSPRPPAQPCDLPSTLPCQRWTGRGLGAARAQGARPPA